MKITIKYVLLGLMVSVLLSACLKDEGNYAYTALPEFYVDTVGQQTSFEVRQSVEDLSIDPKIVFDGQENDLMYQWRLYGGTNDFDTLGTEKILQAPVTRNPGTYTVELQVIQKSNNLSALMRYQVTVVPPVPSGWMVAYEKEGHTEVDVIRSPLFISGAPDTVLRGVFSAINGNPVSGTPVSILYQSPASYILTSEGGVTAQNTDFRQAQNFSQLFIGATPATVKPEAVLPGTWGDAILINNGVVYWTNSGVVAGQITIDELGYQAAPFVYPQYAKIGGFYDQLNMRFVYIDQQTSQAGKYTDAESGARFNLNDIGKKLLFVERGFGQNASPSDSYKYAFFKDVSGTDRYLYVINTQAPLNPDVAAIDISAAPEILNARFYGVGNLGPCAFYATDERVYYFQVDFTGNSTSTPTQGFQTSPGEVITGMKLFKGLENSISASDWESRFMYVATWNEANQEGKVYLLSLNITSGAIGAQPLDVWAIPGKVGDMGYKSN